jgi:hypothetical protein
MNRVMAFLTIINVFYCGACSIFCASMNHFVNPYTYQNPENRLAIDCCIEIDVSLS